MKISEIILEEKNPLKILDLRYVEPSDPSLVLKHWGSHPKDYINPDDGFFFHWHEGRLILHSERNDVYSWKMSELLRSHESGAIVRPVERWLRTAAGKKRQPFELWNMLNGRVDLVSGVVTIHKEHPFGGGAERQRAMTNIKELQDLLRVLLRYGVTPDFKIKGVPAHVAATVGKVLAQEDPTSKILSGSAPVMYHGTSMSRWQEIQHMGLIPGKTGEAYIDLIPGYSEHNVYLGTNPKIAEFYAKRQAKKDGDDQGVILQVKIPDPARLLGDDSYLPRGTWNDEERRVIPPDPEELRRASAGKLPLSKGGRESGSFAYRGRIPPSNIKSVRTLKVT